MFCGQKKSFAKRKKHQQGKNGILNVITKKLKIKSENGEIPSTQEEHNDKMDSIRRMEITRQVAALERYNEELRLALFNKGKYLSDPKLSVDENVNETHTPKEKVKTQEKLDEKQDKVISELQTECLDLKAKLQNQRDSLSLLRRKLSEWEQRSEETYLKDQTSEIEILEKDKEKLKIQLKEAEKKIQEIIQENKILISERKTDKIDNDIDNGHVCVTEKIEHETYEKMRAAIEAKWKQTELELRACTKQCQALKSTLALERKHAAPLFDENKKLKLELTEQKINFKKQLKVHNERLKNEQYSKSKLTIELKQSKEDMVEKDEEIASLKILLQPLKTLIPTTEIVLSDDKSAQIECEVRDQQYSTDGRAASDSGIGLEEHTTLSAIENRIEEVEKRFDKIEDICENDLAEVKIESSGNNANNIPSSLVNHGNKIDSNKVRPILVRQETCTTDSVVNFKLDDEQDKSNHHSDKVIPNLSRQQSSNYSDRYRPSLSRQFSSNDENRPKLTRQGSSKSDLRNLLLSRMYGIRDEPELTSPAAMTLAVARKLQQRNKLCDIMDPSECQSLDGGDSYYDGVLRHCVKSSPTIASLRDLHPYEVNDNDVSSSEVSVFD